MSIRRSLMILALVTIVLPAAVFSQRAKQAETAALSESQNLQLHTVQTGDVEVVVNAIGSIEANEEVQLSLTTPGRIAQVLVQEGDYVLEGDLLLRQADETQHIAYEQAQLDLDLAQLELEDLQKPVDESDIRIAEANVQSAWASYQSLQNVVSSDDIDAANLRIQQAQSAYDEAVRRRTTAHGGQSDEAYALLDAQVGQASFNLEIARQQLQSLQTRNQGQLGAAYARALQAERELDRVKAGPTSYQIQLAQIKVEQAQIKLDSATRDYNRMSLVAPFDSVVSAVNAEVGSIAIPGVPVIALSNISPLHMTAQVDEVDIRQIKEGMQAHVQFDALPNTQLNGVVDQIALLGQDDNGIVSYDVKLRMDDVDPRVRYGMTAEAAVVVDERQDVLMIPNLFVRLDRQNDQAYVNILNEDGTLDEIPVELGLQGQDNSQVLSGLSVGDVVALDLSADRFSFFGG